MYIKCCYNLFFYGLMKWSRLYMGMKCYSIFPMLSNTVYCYIARQDGVCENINICIIRGECSRCHIYV